MKDTAKVKADLMIGSDLKELGRKELLNPR
jgi:hypothetical protein